MASSWRWPCDRFAAVAGEHGVVAVGKVADELIRAGQLCGGDDLFIRRVQPAVADVLHHGAGEQVGVLQDDAQTAPEVVPLDLVYVDAVIADLALVHIVEPVQQVGNGGFAGAGGAYEGDLLAGT